MRHPVRCPASCRSGLALVASVAACACSDTATRRPVVVRDSAGIEIVESSGPTWTTPWQLADAPAVSIGIVEGSEDYQFSDLVSAFRLPDGRIVAANRRRPPVVRVYDADGRFLQSIGGDGEGPGEFRFIFFADALGDTIRVYDPTLARISLFAPSGKLLRMDALTNVGPDPATRFILFPGIRGGGFLGRSNAPRSPTSEAGRHPGMSEMVLTDAAGAPLGPPVEIDDGEYQAAGGSGPALVLFTPRAATVAGDSLVYAGSGADFTIDVFGPDLTLRRRIRRTFEPRPVTGEMIAAHVAERVAAVADPMRRTQLAQSLEGRPAREQLPAHDATFLVDDVGDLWVRGYTAPGEQRQVWSVFGPYGAFLGELELPHDLRILSIEDDRLVAVGLDSLDVQHVQVWEIRKD